MNEDTKLTPIQTNGLDLNLVTEQFKATKSLIEKLGIESATFRTGQTYKQDDTQTVLATDGIMVSETENITVIAIQHKGSTSEDAMQDLNNLTFNQRELGAFVGKSQSWVSSSLTHDKDDD